MHRKTNQGGLDRREIQLRTTYVYENANSECCPVCLYKKYCSLLPKIGNKPNLYLLPLSKLTPWMWYGDRAIGLNILEIDLVCWSPVWKPSDGTCDFLFSMCCGGTKYFWNLSVFWCHATDNFPCWLFTPAMTITRGNVAKTPVSLSFACCLALREKPEKSIKADKFNAGFYLFRGYRTVWFMQFFCYVLYLL